MDSVPRRQVPAKIRTAVWCAAIAMLAVLAGWRLSAQAKPGQVLPPAPADASRPLVFLDDRDYPPHSFLENGVAKGSEIEVANALARVLGRSVRVELHPWAQAQEEVQRGEADALLDFSITDERRQLWDFSAPIFTHDFGLFVRSDEISILGLDSLAGKRVGVVRSGFPSEYLKAVPGVTLVPFETYDQGFSELTLSGIDAVAADTWVGAYAMQRRGIKGVAMVGEPFATRQAGIAVRKGNDALLAQINAAVSALSADGTLAAIHDRWRPQEFVFVSRQSVSRYVMWVGVAFAGVIGAALALWIVTLKRQIRKRGLVEHELAESRARLTVAMDAADLGTWRWTAATGVAERDAKLSEILGLPAAPATQTIDDWMQIVHPDDREAARASFDKTLVGPTTVDFRIVRPSGEVRWLRCPGRPYFDPSGALSYVTGAAFDITDIKTAEAALRTSEDHFAKAFIASPASITISDFDTGIVETNDRFEEITGYAKHEVIGKTLFEAGIIADNSRREELIALLRDHQSVRDFVFRIRRKDGEIRTLSLSAARLEIGGRLRFLSFATDITDQRRLEASLQHASDINRLLVSELETGPLNEAIMRSVGGALRVDYVGLLQCEGAGRPLELKASLYHDGAGAIAPLPKGWDERGPAADALARGDVAVYDQRQLSAFDPTTTTLLGDGVRFLCCAPLLGRFGPVGVLTLATRGSDFSSDDLAVVKQLSTYVGIAIKNAQTYDEVQVLKNHLAEERLYLQEEIRVDHNFEDIIGASPALMRVLSQIETVAPTDSTVLLLGETGTGKELLARAIHDRSQRRDRTFVRINAAALPATLLESELFGYERGAFTGATGTKVGRFELAHRGSLFLDEVGDIPIELQPKLLRVLQEQEFERLGSTRAQRVDVRLIAATNRDLDVMTNDGSFRRDLFYRLNVFPIQVPPLRERPEDIPLLVRHFVRRFSTKLKRRIDTIPASTMAGLTRWHWPGNIRELENVIERAVIISPSPVLQVPMADLTLSADSPVLATWTAPVPAPPVPSAGDPTLAEAEREQILRALRASGGIIAGEEGAAARLGLKRTTLQSKMRKLGISRPSF
jgi:formate hydrogenlyase transcriptional activator